MTDHHSNGTINGAAEAFPDGAALDLYTGRGEAERPAVCDPETEYRPGTRSSLPANDSLAGLAYMAGVPVIAREVARSMAARRGFEELIAHQVAAGHAFSMNVLSQCNNQFLSATARADGFDHLLEINARTAATGLAGVRMMAAVQRGMLLFDRLRAGAPPANGAAP
jgi:hypothetical protein